MKVIVLAAGKAERLKPIINSGEKILLPIASRPIGITFVLQYVELGIKEFVIVVSPENEKAVREVFLNFFAKSDLKFEFEVQKKPNGPGKAMKLCAKYMDTPFLVHLSDTICEQRMIFDKNWIGVSRVSEDFEHWCLVDTDQNGNVVGFQDKPARYTGRDALAAIGRYYFKDFTIVKNILERNDFSEMSEVLVEFIKEVNLATQVHSEWVDTGSLENYTNFLKKKQDCRYFNKIRITDWGTCIKESANVEIIKSEMMWYKNVQNNQELQRLVPRIYSYRENGYEMEYYTYPSLSYVLMYKQMLSNSWTWYLNKLLIQLERFLWKKEKKVLGMREMECAARKMYKEKLRKRLSAWGNQCLQYKEVVINQVSYHGLPYYKELLEKRITELISTSPEYFGIVHGDLVFSNILFSPSGPIYKLIDARGNFGNDSIYGDIRYDLAKLRQCYHSFYDAILSDAFCINYDKNNYNFQIYPELKIDSAAVDALITKLGYKIDEIQIIEIILILSLIPLHKDKPKRQMAFFLVAILALNEFLGENNKKAKGEDEGLI